MLTMDTLGPLRQAICIQRIKTEEANASTNAFSEHLLIPTVPNWLAMQKIGLTVQLRIQAFFKSIIETVLQEVINKMSHWIQNRQ